MCRFATYLGPEIFISSLVTEPKHSLIHQSYHAKEREEPLNGDGFGVGWYGPQSCKRPAVFKEVSPAWSNHNLRDIARVTQSGCIFAHVRAATVGGHVTRTNCHPFSWRNFLFMHNGTIHGFDAIKRQLRRRLSEEAYAMIKGNTDTEHVFALFVDNIQVIAEPDVNDMATALLKSIKQVELLKTQTGTFEPSTMNLVLSDGKQCIATRYISNTTASNSLYLSTGERFYCRDGICFMDEGDKAVLIVSEPLNSSDQWQKIENNHMILVDHEKNISIQPITL